MPKLNLEAGCDVIIYYIWNKNVFWRSSCIADKTGHHSFWSLREYKLRNMEMAIDRIIADPEQLHSTESHLRDSHETVIKYAQPNLLITNQDIEKNSLMQ